MRVAVVGLGGIGGIAAATLAAFGRDVIACARRPLARLRLERPEGDVDVPLRTLVEPAEAAPVDWVLLCTKTYQTASTAPWLARLCAPATRVAVLQNGIDAVARVAPFAGPATILPALVYYNAERLAGDGVRIRHGREADIMVADDANGRAFVELLAGSGLSIHTSDDFTTLSWRKLLLNVTANPITALTLQRQRVLRRDDVQALCRTLLAEAIAVGAAAGARFARDEAEDAMRHILAYPPEAGTSMYFDRLAGRRLEADDLTGAVVAAGRTYGIPTPANETLLTLLRGVDDGAAEKSRPCSAP